MGISSRNKTLTTYSKNAKMELLVQEKQQIGKKIVSITIIKINKNSFAYILLGLGTGSEIRLSLRIQATKEKSQESIMLFLQKYVQIYDLFTSLFYIQTTQDESIKPTF